MIELSLTWMRVLGPLAERAAREGLIDAFEFVPDAYIQRGDRVGLATVLERLGRPYSLHLTECSVASPDFGTRFTAGDKLAFVLEELEPRAISEHLSASRVGSFRYRGNLPPPYSDEYLGLITDNVRLLRASLPRAVPFLLENVPSQLEFASSTMRPGVFLSRLAVATDSGILLDLHNLYVDERNGGPSCERALEDIDLDRVGEIHVAGGHREAGRYVDGHSAAIPARVMDLLAHTLTRCRPARVNLEREQRFDAYDELRRELGALRELVDRHG